ncbi:MAG: amidohydrolase [Thermoanaerobaculia bacterium]|nr:amidohydrolase [Thermoanaerobaculia bacterium]
MRTRGLALALAALAALGCRSSSPGPAPAAPAGGAGTATSPAPVAGSDSHDHHVHLLSAGLIRDWKALGASFSRPDSAYLSADALLGPPAGDPAARPPVDRAVLVSMAHLYGHPEFRAGLALTPDEERLRAAAENDHVALQAARYPGSAVAFCSVSALRPHALAELTRCRREHGVGGIKLHLANSGIDLREASHLAAVAALADFALAERVPILLHLDPQLRGHTVADVAHFARIVLAPRPELTVIVAHLGGSGGYGAWTRSVFATLREWLAERAANEAPAPRIWFDLSAVLLERESEGVPATSPEEAARLGADLRDFGFERLLFGSDAPVFHPDDTARLLVERAGLTPAEVAELRARTIPGLFAD